MAKIENNVSVAPNYYEFEGRQFNLQLSMYVVSQFEDFNDILNSMGKIETIFKMATAMINSDIIKNKINIELYTPEYVASCTSMTDLPKLTEVIAKAMGFREQTEAEKELDALAESEGAPDTKN